MSAASSSGPTSGVLLQVRDLRTHFPIRTGVLKAVDGVSFDVERGKTLCVVGESGSGKSVTARSILQIVDEPGRIVGRLDGAAPTGRQHASTWPSSARAPRRSARCAAPRSR
jgi:peptide/nickel transport system ATP-binding protein